MIGGTVQITHEALQRRLAAPSSRTSRSTSADAPLAHKNKARSARSARLRKLWMIELSMICGMAVSWGRSSWDC